MTATSVSIDRFATAGKPPAPLAPGAGDSKTARPFGQQLQDARNSAGARGDDEPASHGKSARPESGATSQPKGQRAAAREPQKKDQKQGSAAASVTPGVPPPPPPLPFSLGLPVVLAESADSHNPEAPGGDPRQAPGPAAANLAPSLRDQTEGTAAPGGTEPNGTQQNAVPDPMAGNSDSETLAGGLSFALRLNNAAPEAGSPASTQMPLPADTQIPAGSQETATLQTQSNPQNASGTGKDSPPPAQDGTSVRLNAIGKEAAVAVAPVKEARQSGTGQDSAQSGQRSQTQNIQTVTIPVPAKSAAGSSAPPPSYSQPAPPDAAAKALDATPTAAPASDQTAKTPAPLKDLAIQVGQTPHDKVEVRVVDRAGELQVAVRATNPDLAQGLRQGLSDLVNRLEQNGFRAEAWRPGTAASPAAAVADARQKPAQFQNDGSQSQSGNSQQGRQQNGQNQPRPRWVEELEGSLTGGHSSLQGESYGISR